MLQVGQIVDNYRLDELIHRGRGTLVFAATDLALRRRVAFKVLAGTSASDPRSRDRFVREAQTAAALDANPHIVTVYRWGQVEDSLYFVTEFVVGISMEELVERQPGGEGLTVVEAVELLRQVGGAVDFAHRRGVVHRDIKPANIMVRMTETPLTAYLIDFGITKVDQVGAVHVGGQGSSGEDGSGEGDGEPPALVGTPDYVAPEVIAGEPVDWRADVYSFGCTAYEMLSGAPPFADAPHDAARLAAHIGTPVPSITVVRPSLPAGFDTVFRRVLAKQAEDRYGSCQEFVAALAAELPAEAHEYARPTAGPRWRVVRSHHR
jgi:serine/threonine-protein kinase